MWFLLWLLITVRLQLPRKYFFIFISVGLIVLLLVFVPICVFFTNQHPFIWLMQYILSNLNRIIILSYWFVMSISVTLIIVLLQNWLTFANMMNHRRLTSIRKLFHVLICFVYFPGMFYDRGLLMLCSYGMLILLFIVEAIRFFKFQHLSPIIDCMLKLFVDEKDHNSKLILSHVYLLIGCSLPLWLSNIDGE